MLDWPSPVTVIVAVIVLVLAATIYWLMGFYDPITYTDYLKKDVPPVPDSLKQKHFAVVGAGFCGLGLAGALRRHHTRFTVFEATDHVGGNWSHGVYDSTHIISSKKTTEFKDLPMPEEYPDFPSAAEMREYLNNYADHFKLREHVRFETKVKEVRPLPADRWELELEDGSTEHFDGVIIANGHHWDCRWAGPYEGEELFTGERMHSKAYKQPGVLRGKRVLVIGAGNSACDIAVAAGMAATEAHISVRRGVWFLPRTVMGKPLVEMVQPWMPIWLQRLVLRVIVRFVVGKYTDYGLQEPKHKLWTRHPTINSDLLNYCKLGRVKPHPDIDRFLGGKRVRFVDGTEAEFDLIVHATGYHCSVPLAKEGLIHWAPSPTANDSRLYPQNLVNGLIHATHRHFYLFGMSQVRYGAGPLITAAADTLCYFIKAQESLKHPLGVVLRRLGRGPIENYISDPHQGMRRLMSAQTSVKRLPFFEWLLVRDKDVQEYQQAQRELLQ